MRGSHGGSRCGEGEGGIERVRHGRGFRYVRADGRGVRDAATLARIRTLAIPPAWTDVWICPDPAGHVQATGRDARGRKQYRYHARWTARRSETKFERMVAFGEALPRIRRAVAADVASAALSRRKVAAVVVELLERSLIRVGHSEYARHNDAYGLATLRDRHVRIDGAELRFRFRGKGGKRHEVVVSDRRLARVVKRCMDLPGGQLFQYVDEEGAQRGIDAADVNTYLREVAGDAELCAKEFRTWGATLLACCELQGRPPPASEAGRRRVLVDVMRRVGERLGNTPAVCRRSYVCPMVIDAWEQGALGSVSAASRTRTGLAPAERALLTLLQRRRAPARAAA